MMRALVLCLTVALLIVPATAGAAVFTFASDPFEGSTAPTTPGRQVVGGEALISFSIASDVFVLDQNAFGVGSDVQFANDVVGNLPTSNVNVIVLQTFDDDASGATPFGAGNAANLIAEQITSPGAGFFIYFNSGLDLPRLVFSVDLSDNTSDLKILARLTNLTGQAGRDALPDFTAANFDIAVVPEPASLLLLTSAGALWAGRYGLRRRRRRR
jgi:hypothetical protein